MRVLSSALLLVAGWFRAGLHHRVAACLCYWSCSSRLREESAREAGTAYWVLAASRSCGPPPSVGASLADGDGDDVESVVERDREGCEDCPDEAGASFGVP